MPEKLLRNNRYPGRGIIIGRCPDNTRTAYAYFIMGRSENSRNRVFIRTNDGIKTEAFDPAKLSDPSLVIYSPVRKAGGCTVVTNGDQTDTICRFLSEGGSFEDALRTRTFEPDTMSTPRISGIIYPDGGYKLSILKSMSGDPGHALRYFYEFMEPRAGTGHFIHTYSSGDAVPSFEGEPAEVKIPDSMDGFAELIWDSLDKDNKVSLYVCYTDLKTGESESRIINKY